MPLIKSKSSAKEKVRESQSTDDSPAGPSSPAEPIPPSLRVSAILIGYNQADALRRAIQALEQSTDRERLEILVVDCGSEDESRTLDQEFPSINLLRLPHHLGATRAMNIAARTAKTDLLFYVSPSVEVAPDTVTSLAARLDPPHDPSHAPAAQDPSQAELIAVCPLLVSPEGDPSQRFWDLPDPETLAAACQGAELPPFPLDSADPNQEGFAVPYPSADALMVRKLFVRGMNHFDERLGHHWADADLALQARRGGKQIRVYPSIRAILHPEPDPLQGEPLAESDRVAGAVRLVSKYYGSALAFQCSLALKAIAGFNFRLLSAVVGGGKLDGSQAG